MLKRRKVYLRHARHQVRRKAASNLLQVRLSAASCHNTHFPVSLYVWLFFTPLFGNENGKKIAYMAIDSIVMKCNTVETITDSEIFNIVLNEREWYEKSKVYCL